MTNLMHNNLFPNLDFSAAIDYLQASENIVITAHINPDGDAIGSSLSLYYALKDMGKKVEVIINESKCPAVYSFLSRSKKIKKYNPVVHNSMIYSADVIIVVDVGNLSRVKIMEDVIRQSPAKKILIDHHIDPDNFANYTLSDTTAIATGEIVFALLELAKIKITKEIADALYCAIYTDSGGFRFSNTTPRTHIITAALLEAGTLPSEIYEKIYNTNPLPRMQLQGLAMTSMQSYLDDQLTFIFITKEMFRITHTTNEDTENISQIPLSVAGTKVGILVIEYDEKTELRVSLRSKGNIDVQQIALKFGGGGHLNAAGCRMQNINIEDAKQILLDEVKKIIQ